MWQLTEGSLTSLIEVMQQLRLLDDFDSTQNARWPEARNSSDITKTDNTNNEDFMWKPPVRFWVGIMIFFSCFTTYVIRVHYPMLSNLMVYDPENPERGKSDTLKLEQRYAWQSKEHTIIAAHSVGFLFTNILGGILAELYGPFVVIFWSNLLSGILVCVTGYSALIHWSAVFGLRFFIGLLGGLFFPAAQCLIVRWAPANEKGRFVSLMLGSAIGSFVFLPLTGVVAYYYGYHAGFYLCGTEVLVFCLAFWFIVTDDPATHRWISDEERDYIIASRGAVSTKRRVAPFKAMALSLPFYAAIIAHFGDLWGLFLQLTEIPLFLNKVLGFDIKNTGVFAGLPYLARFLSGLLFGYIGDIVIHRDLMSTTSVRKTFAIYSHLLPGVFLLLLMFTTSVSWIIVLVTVSLMFNGAVTVTNLHNPHDLAPNFAGSLYGIMETFASPPGFLIPLIVADLTKTSHTMNEWQWVFFMSGIIYIFTGIIFMVFGTGKVQPYNEIQDENEGK